MFPSLPGFSSYASLTPRKETEKSARDAQAKAEEIDAAVFDLKAVNPNVVTKLDERTSDEIIENIEEQGKIVASALQRLKMLLQND